MLGSVVFGYLVILSFVTARITVTVSKKKYNVQAGDDVTLECSIHSDDGPLDSVYWEKGSREVVYRSSDSGTDKKYSGSSTAGPSLTIHSTTTRDSGNYYCVGRKGSSRGFSDWINLRVIEVIVPLTTYSVQTGTSVSLQCSISPLGGVTTVYWTKEGLPRQVYSSDSLRNNKYYTARNNPSLTIYNTVVEDTGRYTCRALLPTGYYYSSSPINVTSSHIHLTVYKPFTASIRPDSTDFTVQEGQRFTARTCEADGCPPGCVTQWTLPNGEQKTSAIFTRPVTREQAGMYTCTASIGDDRHSESFSVTVNYGPKTFSLFPPGDVSVQEGGRINVPCQASCSPSCYIYWTGPNTYKDGKRGANLSIGSADKTDHGVYVCTAFNDYGNISTSLKIDVKYGPSNIVFEPTDRRYRKLEGDIIPDVLCTADCNPACHVTWTRNNARVSDTGTLSLGRLDTSKDGTYTCTARGGTSTKTETINVTTLYGPKDISLFPPGDVSVQEGGRINVRCEASCSPSCDIYWTGPNTYKAGKRGANLSIRSADKNDRGVYVCTASNDYGNISTSLRVTVNYAGSDIKLVPNDTHYSYKEGTVLPDIQCEAECNPACNMSWYHDRTGRILKGSQLSLKSMERSKDGNYLCNATNRLGTQILSLTIVSLFPPEILRKDLLNTSYIVDMWDSIVSSISVDASPLPDADLVHVEDNQQVTTKVELTFQRQPDFYRTKYFFSIRNITYSDVGHYTLTVSNSQGSFTYRFSINFIHEELLSDAVPTPVILVGISVLAVIIVILIVVLIIVVRRKINKEKRAKESGESDDGLSGEHNALYGQQDIAPAGLLGFPQQPADNAEGFVEIHDAEGRPNPVNDVYAEVVKPRRNNRAASVGTSNEYATVTKPSVTDRAKSSGPREIHNRVPTPTAGNGQKLQTPRTTNKDGLIYLEVDFTKKTEGEEAGKVTILGIENKCDYGQIDFSKKITLPEDMGN